jgi:hypothetical protein
MWGLKFSSEVIIFVSFYVVMAPNSIIEDASMTCSWCMSRCCLLTGSTRVEGAIPFKVCRISTFKTLILLSSIVSPVSCSMRVIQLSGSTRKGSERNYNSNLLWLLDLLMSMPDVLPT